MLVPTNAKIDRMYEVLSYLNELDANRLETAIDLYEVFAPYSTYQKVTQAMVADGLIDCIKTNDDNANNLNRYWLEPVGSFFQSAIETGILFDTDNWLSEYRLFSFYFRYGDEQDYLPFILKNLGKIEIFEKLGTVSHPVGLAVYSAMMATGRTEKLSGVNLSDYTHKGGDISMFASDALDKLMALTQIKTMQKNKQARKNTMSSILEFCIVFTYMHMASIIEALENSDDS